MNQFDSLTLFLLGETIFIYDNNGDIHGFDKLGKALAWKPSIDYIRENGDHMIIHDKEEWNQLFPKLNIEDIIKKMMINL